MTEDEIDAAIERLREQSADFVDVTERGVEMEDFAVLDFEGTIEGKPIAEVAPKASKNLMAERNSGSGLPRIIFFRALRSN